MLRPICRSLWLSLLAVLLALFARCVSPALADENRPNIVFFLSDDQRADAMRCAGHPIIVTPHMDRLAQDGTRFVNAFVTTSICAASRATLFTGLYERSHKYTFRTPPLDREFTDNSYPRRLREAGYRTGFVGKFGVGVERGVTDEMFDYYRPLNRAPYFKKQPDGSQRHVSQIAGDLAIEFLKQPSDKPFCLSVSFNAPHAEDGDKRNHYPWPKAVDGLYDHVTIPPPHLSDPAIFESQPDFLKESLNRQRWFWRWDTPEKWQKNVKGYYRMISGIDHVMGRVLAELEVLGVSDNTVIVFQGDNGYYLGSRGFAGKWSHYEESLRVPMIIHDPRVPENRGAVAEQIVLNVDIAHTILNLAGVDVPESYQGRDLSPIVKGESPEKWRDEFFCEHLMHFPGGIPKWEGVRGSRWVYARYIEQNPPFEFLHDLQEDPGQLKNLASDANHQQQLVAMRKRCNQLRDEYGGAYNLEKFPAQPARERNRPNVVMIISDDQSWTDYGFMGHPVIKTPNIDRLAKQSATFRRGYVPTSLCRPSLATLVTGLYAHQHGITGNDPAVPMNAAGRDARRQPDYQRKRDALISKIDRVTTLPSLLASYGYVSFQTGKWWEGNPSRGGFTDGMTHGDPTRGGRHGDEGLKIGREGLQPIFDFIEQADSNPFFVWYAPFLPHTPHNPPQRLLQKYQAPGRPVQLARYYAMCEWFDETCGQLLDYLDENDLAGNTIVVYVTDNGWIQRTPDTKVPMGWRPSFAPKSKQSPNEGGTRTPIMVRWPGGRIKPGNYDALVSSIDLAPTILRACQADVPDQMPGISLLRACRGEPLARKAIMGEGFAHDIADLDDPSASLLYRWCIEGRWKLIRSYDGQLGRYRAVHPRSDGKPQLYDLQADPHETRNLAEEHPEIIDRLSKRLEEWWTVDGER